MIELLFNQSNLIPTDLQSWLLQQAGIVVVMGVAIFWLTKRYSKSEQEKTDLAREVIKLTTAYETKLDNDKNSDSEIKESLHRIERMLEKWGN